MLVTMGNLKKAWDAKAKADEELKDAKDKALQGEIRKKETAAEEAGAEVMRKYDEHDEATADPEDKEVAKRIAEGNGGDGSGGKPVHQVPQRTGLPSHVPEKQKA